MSRTVDDSESIDETPPGGTAAVPGSTWLHSLLSLEPPPPTPSPDAWRAVGADRNDQRSAPAGPRVPVDGFGLVELGRSDPKPAPPPQPVPEPPRGPFSGYMPGSIAHALTQLDPDRERHWTSQGLPRLDALYEIMGCQPVERRELNEAWPGFNRRAAREYRATHGVPSDVAPLPVASAPDEQAAFRARLARVRAALDEHTALERAIGRPLPRPDLRCPLQRRIAAENRMARYNQDRRR